MPPTETLPAPVLPLPPSSKWRREQDAFRRLLPDLLRLHRDQYVAIHEGAVVEVGSDKLAVAQRAYERCGYVPIFVSRVTGDAPLVVRMPSPRLVQPDKPA